jgi:POT family proton-dependent oligopeptide transporter
MGINIGALISPLFCGWVGERISWRLGFGVAGLGMLAGLVQYLLTSRHLGSAGLHPASTGNAEEDRRERQKAIRALGIGIAVVAFLAALGMSGVVELTATMISDGVGWCLLGISVLVFSWLIFFGNWSPVERKRSAAILVLFVSSALFWAAFEQAGSSLSLFAERGTDCSIFGFSFPQAGSRACSRFS